MFEYMFKPASTCLYDGDTLPAPLAADGADGVQDLKRRWPSYLTDLAVIREDWLLDIRSWVGMVSYKYTLSRLEFPVIFWSSSTIEIGQGLFGRRYMRI